MKRQFVLCMSTVLIAGYCWGAPHMVFSATSSGASAPSAAAPKQAQLLKSLEQAKIQEEAAKKNVMNKDKVLTNALENYRRAIDEYNEILSKSGATAQEKSAKKAEKEKAQKALDSAVVELHVKKKQLADAEQNRKDLEASEKTSKEPKKNAEEVTKQTKDAQPTALTLTPEKPTVTIGETKKFSGTGGKKPYTFSIEDDETGNAKIDSESGVYTAGSNYGRTTVRITDSSAPTNGTKTTYVQVKSADIQLLSCKRDSNLAIYTNDLPSWRFGDGLFSFLPDGEWTVGTAILSETIRYDFGKKKAAVFEGAGVGASFRFYRDVEDVGRSEKLKLHEIKSECRASSLETANKRTIATPMFSITPAIFASKPLKDQEFRVEPAILLGFFQDLINVGAGFNLTGDDGDVGDVFLLFSLGFGFNFGGSDTAD